MSEIRIGSRLIGDSHPTFIIAEIGVNHNGSLDLALKLIDLAVECGVDAVKFQKRDLTKIYPARYLDHPNVGEKSAGYMIPILQRVELSEGDYHEIISYCNKKGVIFLCTPFDMSSVDFVDTLGVPAFKVASADLTNLMLLEHLVSKHKPLILSTGMSTMVELTTTVDFLRTTQVEFALLHCNSTYPAPFESINLRFIETLHNFGVPVGYSGHERGIAITTAAVALGACIIERHLTLDRTMEGPDHAASLEPQGFSKLVRDVRNLEVALGSSTEKFISMGEMANREILAKSLVAAQTLVAGEVITTAKVTVKGPGTGLSPQMLPRLLGRTMRRNLEIDEPFLQSDIEQPTTDLMNPYAFPLRWGFVARFRDMQQILAFNPLCLEIHLTDSDLHETFPGGNYQQELIVHAPEFWEHTLVDLCTDHMGQRVESVSLIQRSIDLARGISPHFSGTPKVVVHPGAMHLDGRKVDQKQLSAYLLRSLSELDFVGVDLLLENLPPRPWYFGGQWTTSYFMDADDIEQWCQATGLGICLDICHLKLYCNWSKKIFIEQAKRLVPYTHHLHLSDAAGIDGEGLQIGDGSIDFMQFFSLLGNDYAGTLVPEIWRGHQDNAIGFVTAIQRLAAAYNAARDEQAC